ncbi:hypothetical protein PL81_21820 [Streptomyces sp. RSD-27]|nr:hypothetical protein PL81_21820 [Streptomyces sp. RSD-27]
MYSGAYRVPMLVRTTLHISPARLARLWSSAASVAWAFAALASFVSFAASFSPPARALAWSARSWQSFASSSAAAWSDLHAPATLIRWVSLASSFRSYCLKLRSSLRLIDPRAPSVPRSACSRRSA